MWFTDHLHTFVSASEKWHLWLINEHWSVFANIVKFWIWMHGFVVSYFFSYGESTYIKYPAVLILSQKILNIDTTRKNIKLWFCTHYKDLSTKSHSGCSCPDTVLLENNIIRGSASPATQMRKYFFKDTQIQPQAIVNSEAWRIIFSFLQRLNDSLIALRSFLFFRQVVQLKNHINLSQFHFTVHVKGSILPKHIICLSQLVWVRPEWSAWWWMMSLAWARVQGSYKGQSHQIRLHLDNRPAVGQRGRLSLQPHCSYTDMLKGFISLLRPGIYYQFICLIFFPRALGDILRS